MAGGDGSDALLTMLANAYLRPGDEVLFSGHAFPLYKIATLRQQRRAGGSGGEETNALSMSMPCWRR